MHNKLTINALLLLCLFMGGGAAVRCTNPRTSLPTSDDMKLKGTWTKQTQSDCGQMYPAQIEFKDDDRYSAQPDNGATQHPIWDVGTWTIVDKQIKISTANDAIITYAVSLKDTILTIKAPDGCTLEYKKG